MTMMKIVTIVATRNKVCRHRYDFKSFEMLRELVFYLSTARDERTEVDFRFEDFEKRQ